MVMMSMMMMTMMMSMMMPMIQNGVIVPLLLGKILLLKGALLVAPRIAAGAFIFGQGTSLICLQAWWKVLYYRRLKLAARARGQRFPHGGSHVHLGHPQRHVLQTGAGFRRLVGRMQRLLRIKSRGPPPIPHFAQGPPPPGWHSSTIVHPAPPAIAFQHHAIPVPIEIVGHDSHAHAPEYVPMPDFEEGGAYHQIAHEYEHAQDGLQEGEEGAYQHDGADAENGLDPHGEFSTFFESYLDGDQNKNGTTTKLNMNTTRYNVTKAKKVPAESIALKYEDFVKLLSGVPLEDSKVEREKMEAFEKSMTSTTTTTSTTTSMPIMASTDISVKFAISSNRSQVIPITITRIKRADKTTTSDSKLVPHLSPSWKLKFQADVRKDVNNFFKIVTFLDEGKCLEKMVCDIHSKAARTGKAKLSAYEIAVVDAFKILESIDIMPMLKTDSSTNYKLAAQLGRRNYEPSSQASCINVYSSCKYSTEDIVGFNNKIVAAGKMTMAAAARPNKVPTNKPTKSET